MLLILLRGFGEGFADFLAEICGGDDLYRAGVLERPVFHRGRVGAHGDAAAGFVDGGLLDAAGVGTLASIPSKETLIAKMLGSMMAPLYSFARVLQAKIDKDGGAPAEAPAEA